MRSLTHGFLHPRMHAPQTRGGDTIKHTIYNIHAQAHYCSIWGMARCFIFAALTHFMTFFCERPYHLHFTWGIFWEWPNQQNTILFWGIPNSQKAFFYKCSTFGENGAVGGHAHHGPKVLINFEKCDQKGGAFTGGLGGGRGAVFWA